MTTLPDAAVSLAERQLGVVARFQLMRWLTPHQIDGLVQREVLVRIERGVYRLRGGAVVAGQTPLAAALRARPPVTITGPAALGLHGVDGFDADGPFELLTAPERRFRKVGFLWRPDPTPARTVTPIGEVQLAAPGDALVHSVAWRDQLGDRPLRLAYHWLGWRELLDREAYLARLVRQAERDTLAACLLEMLGGPALAACQSDGEVRLGRVLSRFDPLPSSQAWLTPRRRGDFLFEECRLVVEYDGPVDHTEDRDSAWNLEVTSAGFHVVRFRDADLRDEDAVLDRMVVELARRAAQLGVRPPRLRPPDA
ncbi:DUF559 domain-containing protein [Nitriliruptoraceae bacterium ZYF776]|nr:DUF559 domain-containing protein [Profundirhabdus halotolerans]